MLTVFISLKNRYYSSNINIISKCNHTSHIDINNISFEQYLPFYSINKIISNIDSHYLLFLNDDTQLNSMHFQDIVSQLQIHGKNYYCFQELYLDNGKWIPLPEVNEKSNFDVFCRNINGTTRIIINKNFLTSYFSVHEKLNKNIFRDKHFLFYLYKNFSGIWTDKVLSLQRAPYQYMTDPVEVKKIFSDFSQIQEYIDDDEFLKEICKTLTQILSKLILKQKTHFERLDLFLDIKNYLMHFWPRQIIDIEIFGQKISLQNFLVCEPIQFLRLAKIIG